MKKIFAILIVIVSAVLILSFAKDMIIKTSVEHGVEFVTGLPLKMQSFKVGIIKQIVGIRSLRLFNPKGYEDRVMLDMPEIYVDYNLPSIIKGTIHLEEMRITMKEFLVVKNEKGELNLDSLKVVKARKEGAKPQEKARMPKIQIDTLELKIGKVIYKDYSKGEKPSVREFKVNLDERYKNIKNPNTLVTLIVVKALVNTTIASLTGFDLQGLENTISNTLATAQEIAATTVKKAEEITKQAVEKTTETIKETQETIKKTTEQLKETLKLPFGSGKEE